MFELKPLHPDAIQAALDKAHRYRMLNEALEAESICRDVLAIDPENRRALTVLLLALTDQFERKLSEKVQQAREVLGELADGYERVYYEGIICERRAKVALTAGGPGSGYMAYDWFRQAMELYEQAIELRPPGNDDPILRWNTCARVVNRNPSVRPEPEDRMQEMLE